MLVASVVTGALRRVVHRERRRARRQPGRRRDRPRRDRPIAPSWARCPGSRSPASAASPAAAASCGRPRARSTRASTTQLRRAAALLLETGRPAGVSAVPPLTDAFRTLHDADLARRRARHEPDRPRDRGDGAACRGRRGSARSRRPRHMLVPAEVVGFRDGRMLLMPLGEMHGIGPGNSVLATERPSACRSASSCSAASSTGSARRSTAVRRSTAATSARRRRRRPPLGRARIDERLSLGVRALDSLVPCGRGQRIGIFAGSGVGKSSLLGMIARGTEGRRQRHLPRRRARPRGARVRRARPRRRG